MTAKNRLNQEARRMAVDSALKELLVLDTNYRKALDEHLESRINAATDNRLSRLEHFKQSRSKKLSQEKQRFQQQQTLINQIQRDQINKIRQRINQKENRILKFKENQIELYSELKLNQERKNFDALKLRKELEAKLDAWREQVLQVQSQSIKKAEEKARIILEERRERIASENRERIEKHSRMILDLCEENQQEEKLIRKEIQFKQKRVEQIIKEKELDKIKARNHAAQMSKFRETIKARLL